MKIMHVIESLGVGGAEQLLATLLPALQRMGNDVMVAVRTDRLDLARMLDDAGVMVVPLPRRLKWNLIGAALDISRLADKYCIEIIHAHLYFPAQATALVKLLRLHSAATVVTFHNLAYAEGANTDGMRLRIKKRLAAFLYPRGFDQKIAVSKAVALHYCRSLGLDAIEIVHNPVDIDAIDSLQLHRDELSGKMLHIVVPGRLVREKGQSDLLEALALLPGQGGEFRVTIAGDGPLRAELEQKTRQAGLGHVVSFTGMLAHEALLGVVSTADVVVIPSRFEGFGLVAIEAMALSRPVIVTAVGGLVEIVTTEKNGIVVPAHEPSELAEALRRLMSSPALRETLGRAGRNRVEEAFALPFIAQKTFALYEQAVTLHQAKNHYITRSR